MSPVEEPGSALRRGWRAPVATLLVALATCASLGSLSGVLADGPWLRDTALAVLATAAVVAGVRALVRVPWLPSLAGLAVAAYGVLVLSPAAVDGPRLLPDAESAGRAAQLARDAVRLIEVSVVPLSVDPPVQLLVTGAAVLVFLAADLLAVGCGMPALTGVAFVAVWTPAVVLGEPGAAWAAGGTGFAYLLLLALGQPWPSGAGRSSGARRTGGVVAASAALVAVTVAAGPLVAALPAWSWLELPDVGSGAAGPVRLSDDLDLRDSLRQQSDQVVLRYSVARVGRDDDTAEAATAGLVGPLRSFTLRDFDGRSWSRGGSDALAAWDPAALLTSDADLLGQVPDEARGTLARVDLRVGALREDRLPVSTFPRTVEIDGPWRYDVDRDEVVGQDRTRPGTAYTMVVQVPDLTPDVLRAAGDEVPDGLADYLTVPDTEHADDLRALAAEVTQGAGTAYDRALALQSYFRDSSRFRYDTSVEAGSSDDAVWDFLESRRGYCVQYATSMTVLARTLGIPARLGVGFLPGRLGSDRTYRITGADAHAWPELYFPGSGWVRFEPTPAVQTGPPPAWSNPYAASATAPQPSAAAPVAPVAPSAAPSASAAAPVPATTGRAASPARAPLAATAAAVLLAAAGALLWWLRSRRAEERLTPEAAWERLRRRLGQAGVRWSDALTPRQAAAAARDGVAAARERPLGDKADAALARLAAAVEAERYAPRPPDVAPEQLRAWVGAVLTDVSGSSRHAPASTEPAGRGRA